MKKLSAGFALALLASALLPVGASATHSPGQGPTFDFVNGTSQFLPQTVIDQQIHVNARSGPLGEDPRGHFFIRAVFPDADVRGSISCLTVVGNTASVGLEIERSRTPAFPAGSGVLLFVADNGEPGDDDSFNGFFTPTPPQSCPPPFPQSGAGQFQGNYVVHDAAP